MYILLSRCPYYDQDAYTVNQAAYTAIKIPVLIKILNTIITIPIVNMVVLLAKYSYTRTVIKSKRGYS